jgi:hypothetical protein
MVSDSSGTTGARQAEVCSSTAEGKANDSGMERLAREGSSPVGWVDKEGKQGVERVRIETYDVRSRTRDCHCERTGISFMASESRDTRRPALLTP